MNSLIIDTDPIDLQFFHASEDEWLLTPMSNPDPTPACDDVHEFGEFTKFDEFCKSNDWFPALPSPLLEPNWYELDPCILPSPALDPCTLSSPALDPCTLSSPALDPCALSCPELDPFYLNSMEFDFHSFSSPSTLSCNDRILKKSCLRKKIPKTCLNCKATKSSKWRRSIMDANYFLCNACGNFKNIHA